MNDTPPNTIEFTVGDFTFKTSREHSPFIVYTPVTLTVSKDNAPICTTMINTPENLQSFCDDINSLTEGLEEWMPAATA